MIMKDKIFFLLFVLITQLIWIPSLVAQNAGSEAFMNSAARVRTQLEESLAELSRLRKQIADQNIPLTRQLNALEAELNEVRVEYQSTTRLLDSHTLDLTNLRNEIKSRQEETTYLSNLLSEYIRNFESRMHISELQRYEKDLEKAKLALDNTNLSTEDLYAAQAALISASIERLHDALNGTKFSGTAVDQSGLIKKGEFVLVGHVALFESDDQEAIGMAEQRLGSLEPTVIPFNDPQVASQVTDLMANGKGAFPFDPTLGNANKIEATKETFLEHVQKGGPVMYPIFFMAGAALLVALYKWIYMLTIRKPNREHIEILLDAVSKHDRKLARQAVHSIGGPCGTMLEAGVEHIKEPRDLIEEVMFEKILETRLKVQSMLPFISISAASAPLLGLLGTVTGIINTFKLITVFGSGDVKTLSGGISEALITTKFGLVVAIPSLLLYAFLSRYAKGIIDQMEKVAVAFVNQVSKSNWDEFERKQAQADAKAKADSHQAQPETVKTDSQDQPSVIHQAQQPPQSANNSNNDPIQQGYTN
jgi:biopolymer transport protein ExbB